LYKNAGDCARKIVKTEGLLALQKGLSAQFFRVVPHTLLTFTFWEHLNKLADARGL
jgi:solute carrier family 25 protein 34/35